MKWHSINRWIIRCFLIMLAISLAFSATANIHEAYVSTMREEMEWADACAKNVRHLLTHQWTVEELEASPEDGVIADARITMRGLCEEYEFDAVYVYRVDPATGERKYCVQGRIDENGLSLSYPSVDMAEKGTGLTPGETALLSGAEGIQQEFKGMFDDEFRLLAPYTDDQGRLLAIIGMNDNTEQLWQKTLRSFLNDIIPFALSMLTGFLILLALVKRRIVTPLHRLMDSMRRFSEDGSRKPEPLNIAWQDEIREIATTYEKMTEDISNYIRNIEALTRKQAETDVQLEVARKIQYGLVPEQTKLSGEGYSVCAMTHPAKAVGGDFYDCFRRNDGSVCVVMGDVSGKGVSAAIFMAMARTLIREKLMVGLSPCETLNQANDALCAQNPEGLFVTTFAAVMNPLTGEVRYANAGHTYPIRLGERIEVLKPESGIALGLFEDAGLADGALTLSPSEGLLLYTDGVTEAVNPEEAFFGMEGLLKALRGMARDTSPEETILTVSRAVYAHCKGMEPFDDMALLALLRIGLPDAWRPLPLDMNALEAVKKAVFEAADMTPEARRAILACDELISNIVGYSGATSLLFSCKRQGEVLRICFSDDGVYFDPTAADIEQKDFEALDSGGMGLGIIRQTASELRYRREDGRNLLELSFPLGG